MALRLELHSVSVISDGLFLSTVLDLSTPFTLTSSVSQRGSSWNGRALRDGTIDDSHSNSPKTLLTNLHSWKIFVLGNSALLVFMLLLLLLWLLVDS